MKVKPSGGASVSSLTIGKTMTILSILKKWYFDTFLPYEDPNHPLYAPQYEEPDWDEMCLCTGSPNAFHKATEWEKWGDKWYKKY